jgi:hypothetical protein
MLQTKSIVRCIGIIILFSIEFSSYSQSNYTFTPSIGTYSPISGTDVDIDAYSSINIGFTFSFNGVNYTQVVPSKWGWLSFNTNLTPAVAAGLDDGNLTSSAARPLIGALYCQNGTIASSRARYLVSGSAPNRVFTFEWYDWKWHWYTTHRISFQVKLYETSNKIECCYHPISFDGTFYLTTSIGLAFADAGDFLSLSNFSNNPSVSTEVESHDFFSAPTDNLKYTFDLKTTKPEPTNQCTNLTTSIVADNLLLSWDDATGAVVPDGYLIKASTSNNFTDPTDGTAIVPDNDLSDGVGVVKVLKGQKSYFGWRNVGSSTSFYFKVFAYTNEGLLVNYNTTAAPTTSGTLLRSAPNQHATSFSVKNNSGNLVFDWKDVKRFGNAIKLSYNTSYNDASNYVDCGSNSALNISGSGISLEAWVNPLKTGGAIFQKENSTLDAGYRMFVNEGGELCFGLYINGSWSEVKTIANILPINTWSHICGTYNGSTQSIYINGKLLCSKATSGNITISSTNLFIGRNHTPSLNAFDGKIDEMAIWSIARTQPEIQTDLNLKLTGSEAGLVAYYKCNQGVADSNTGENSGLTKLDDATPNAIHASLINFQYYDSKGITASNTNSDTDGYLLLASSTSSFPVVANGTDFPYDNNLADGAGAVKLAQGIQTFSQWSNTDLLKTNSFRLYPFNNKGSEIVYYTGSTIPELVVKPEPVNHVTNFTAASVQCNVVLNWTDALGAQLPDGYLILASKTGTFTPPIDGIEIAEDKNLADGSGAVKIVSGVQTFSQWIGFESGITYTFAIYPYTNSGLTINYKTNQVVPQSSSSITISAEPTFHATNFTAKNLGTLNLTWKDAFDLKNCLNFDGVDDYISCGLQNTAAFTIEAWINPSRVDVDQAIVSTLNEGVLTGCELHIGATGKPVLTIRNSGAWLDVVSPTAVSSNTWCHLAATFNGSNVVLYVNGVQVVSQAASSFSPGTSQLVIGRRSSGLLNFNGKIDEVRVWSTAQTAANLTANMNIVLLGSESGLISYYKFNQGVASGTNTGLNSLVDATSNNKTGTLNNFALSGSVSNWILANQVPDGYLIKASTTNSFIDPVDFSAPSVDSDLSDGSGVVTVAKGIESYSDWSGLVGQTNYYFKIYPYTNEGNYTNFKTVPAAPVASVAFVKTRPISHVSNLSVAFKDSKLALSWTDASVGSPSFSNSVSLDGLNDYISVPALGSNLSTVTIETWLNYSGVTAAAGVFNTNTWNAKDLHFQIWNSNAIEFAVSGNNPSTPQASYSFVANTWYHVAVTYNSATKQAKYYVNGSLVQTISFTTAVQVNLTAAQLGAWTTSRNFNGKLDEYRIWNTERSQAEIYNNMYSELSGSETGLLAYYKFNQGAAGGNNAGITTVVDASLNGRNGVLTNFGLSGAASNWVSTGNIGYKVAAPDGYLIKASKNKSIAAPTDGTVIPDEINLSDNIGTVTVLQGVQAYNGWTNLNDTTRYYIKVFPFTNSGTARIYNTLPTVPLASDSTDIKQFKEVSISILNFTQGTSAWADYDGDGLLDVMVAGGRDYYTQPQGECNQYNGAKATPTILYKQNALHNFDQAFTFSSVVDASIAWADYNNDGLLDFVLTGNDNTLGVTLGQPTTKLYKQKTDHSFENVLNTGFANVRNGSVAWSDYDNDGDLDLLITGKSSSSSVSLIYSNNGNGTFSEQTEILLPGVSHSSVAWGDYNNDGLSDILLAGFSNQSITKVYKNNGNNSFTEQSAISLPGIEFGVVKWADYDSDGYLDILITGNVSGSNTWNQFSGIYKNDRKGGFVLQPIPSLDGFTIATADWGDYNNDGLADFVIAGNSDNSAKTILYEQDLNHSFIKRADFGFAQLDKPSINFIDYDNDGTLDLFITGQYPIQTCPSCCIDYYPATKLYKNTTFKKNSTPNKPSGLSHKLGNKVLLAWQSSTDKESTTSSLTYNVRIGTTSLGQEVVSPSASTSGFVTVPSMGNCQQDTTLKLSLKVGKTYYWSVQAVDNAYQGGAFSTVSSFYNDSIPSSKLSLKVLNPNSVRADWTRGNGSRCAVFVKMKYSDATLEAAKPVHGVLYTGDSEFRQGHKIGSTGWYCVYNGRNESVTITGLEPNSYYVIDVVEYVEDPSGPRYFRYLSPNNDNRGVFNTEPYLAQKIDGSTNSYGDFNNDGYVDIVGVNGLTGKVSVSLNNGNNTYSVCHTFDLSNISQISVADYNNDGWLDFVIAGTYFTKLYKNNKNSTFTEQSHINFTGVYNGSLAWGDYDNDGDYDLLVCGATQNGFQHSISQIFTNDYPNDSFTLLSGTNFIGIQDGNAAWADFDNDGYLDFAVSGCGYSTGYSCIPTAALYHNNGDGTFAQQPNTVIDIRGANSYCSLEVGPPVCFWADFDKDGDLDLKIAGESPSIGYNVRVYENRFPENKFIVIDSDSYEAKGKFNNAFINEPNFEFYNQVDIDNDGDLDVVDGGIIKRNNDNYHVGNFAKNKTPEAPTNLNYRNKPGFIELSWNNVNTDETPDSLLFYNIRFRKVGTTKWLGAPHSLDSDGFHGVVNSANVRYNSVAKLTLRDTIYEWQVQSIDGTYTGSQWSPINRFEVKAALAKFSADTVCLGQVTNFTDNSFAYDGIASWHWDFGDTSTVSTLQNPTHIYQYPGEHIVRLVVANASGKTDTIYNTILVKPIPKVLFTATDVCSGTTTTIENSTTIADINVWAWDFGDGQNSGYANPASHTYGSTGNYTITLSAIAKNGCSADASHNIVVTTTPNATLSLEYGTPTFCKGDSVIYAAPDNSLYSYQWRRNGVDIAENTSKIKVKDASGGYQVVIINKLVPTCSATSEEKQIAVKERPGMPVIEQPSSKNFCSDKTMLLNTELKTGLSYQWLLNGGTIKDSTRNQLAAKSSGDYTVKVSNSNGCEAISNAVELTMIPLPEIPSVSYGETSICDGSNVTFSVASNPAIAYQWFHNNTPVSGATSSLFTTKKSGSYFLQVSNNNSCSAKTTPVDVVVKEIPAKPIIMEATNTTTFCPGTGVELKISNVYPDITYQWKRSGVAIAGVTQPSYQGQLPSGDYVVQAYNGVCSIESDILTLTTKPSPPKPSLFAKGPNVWLLACDNITAKDYRWYFNEQMITGAKSNQYVANQNFGSYYVSINDGGDCYTNSDVITITSDGVINGVDELFGDAILVHPNPTAGVVNVALGVTLSGELKVEVVNAFGQAVGRFQYKNSSGFTIDLSELPDGVYFCRMSYQNSVVVKKVIKQ